MLSLQVCDFGLVARVHPGSQAGQLDIPVGDRSGTIGYRSPEQALGQPLTAATDIFSFGVLAVTVLTGVRPMIVEGAAHDELKVCEKLTHCCCCCCCCLAVLTVDAGSNHGRCGASSCTPQRVFAADGTTGGVPVD